MKIIRVLGILILFLTDAKAQFFGAQYREQFRYATALSYPQDNNYRILSLGAKPGYWPLSKIFVYDANFSFLDSIPLLKGTVPQSNEPLKLNKRLYWPVIYYDTISNLGGAYSVLELDTTYKHIALHKLGGYYLGPVESINIVHISNRFYVAYVKDFTTTVIYKLDEQFNKLDSLKYSLAISDMHRIDNRLMISSSGNASFPCMGQSFNTLKMLVIDTSFVAQNCFSFDSLGTYIIPNYQIQKISIDGSLFTNKVIPISHTKYFAAGSQDFGYQYTPNTNWKLGIVNGIISDNNQVIASAVFGNSVANTNYFENSNFVAINKNEIITVGCIGNDFQYFNIAQPQKTKIFVNKIDTVGNTIWVKEYGNDMFYRPGSIVFTADGGCLIAGWRYDTTTMKITDPFGQRVYESFLLKLDANGNYSGVGLTENGAINPVKIKCFPNPATNKLVFDVPFQDDIQISMNDVSGKEVLRVNSYQNFTAVDVSTLSSGVYFYKVKSKSLLASGKFIKTEE